ncbi:rod shape-determining protein MreC [Sphaerimonospora cavernae]|uniref:Cell shape-determining protein MreC n=1 Tax=Sphaerimonospora cavernae TaxID=1740611 RepID=A0ABV6TWW7_9ACTN
MRDTRRARLAVGLLLAAALVLITVDHRVGSGPVLGPVHDVASGIFAKAEQVSATVTKPVRDFVGMLRAAPEAERTIVTLRKENAKLHTELSTRQLDSTRAAKLDRMLGLAGLGRYRVVPAQVLARRAFPGFEDAVEIDAGTEDGVRPDMTVLTGGGLVGRVVQAAADSATVLLLTDPALSVGARLEGGNQIGVVSGLGEAGGGDNLIKFRLLDSTVPLPLGGRIVSFGSQRSKPYVPGVPIGVIQRVESLPGELTKIAYAKPFTDFSSLDVVGVVVQAPKRDPRDSVLPPVPRQVKVKEPRKDEEKRAGRGEEVAAERRAEADSWAQIEEGRAGAERANGHTRAPERGEPPRRPAAGGAARSDGRN